MKTSKSTLTVAGMALRAARDGLPDYSHRKSPKKFTQPQLLAALVIKEFLQLDYRGLHVLLTEWSDLRHVLGLTKAPHFTTLCAAAKRLLGKTKADAILDAVLNHCRNELGIRSIVPTTDRGRPRHDDKPRHVTGYHRRLMKQRFPKKIYGQRQQIETVFSMLKRNMGSALRARNYHSRNREIRLSVLTHNMLLVFLKA